MKQITHNLGTGNYDECPSVSSDGVPLMVDTWNTASQHYEISWIDLTTGERGSLTGALAGDAWDPFFSTYTLVWVSGTGPASSLELWIMSFSPIQLTKNNYADFFAASLS